MRIFFKFLIWWLVLHNKSVFEILWACRTFVSRREKYNVCKKSDIPKYNKPVFKKHFVQKLTTIAFVHDEMFVKNDTFLQIIIVIYVAYAITDSNK